MYRTINKVTIDILSKEWQAAWDKCRQHLMYFFDIPRGSGYVKLDQCTDEAYGYVPNACNICIHTERGGVHFVLGLDNELKGMEGEEALRLIAKAWNDSIKRATGVEFIIKTGGL